MSNFNSSISVVGINEVKVQQAILKLLENSLSIRELLGKRNDELTEKIRRLSQKLSTIDLDIDDETAQKIADKISAEIGDSVATATEAARTASSKADIAEQKANQASEDAEELRAALQNIESLIEEKAQSAAETLVQQTLDAVNGATEAAEQASQSANNAAATAQRAETALTNMQDVVEALTYRGLSSTTVYNENADQYRKVATLPAVSSSANSTITFFGSIGGWTNDTQSQVYLTVGQKQSGDEFAELDFSGYYFGKDISPAADIVVYMESNGTFSVYLKGAAAQRFSHNVSMVYNESVTPVVDTFRTGVPTGSLVWSFLANAKRVATSDEISSSEQYAFVFANTFPKIQMEYIVQHADRQYDVIVTFKNNSNNVAYVTVTAQETDTVRVDPYVSKACSYKLLGNQSLSLSWGGGGSLYAYIKIRSAS